MAAALAAAIADGYAPGATAADPLAALEALGRFRILCAVREGRTARRRSIAWPRRRSPAAD